MNNIEQKNQSFTSVFSSIKENKTALFRMWLLLSLFHTISLLLGKGIFIVGIGIYLFLRRILIYWPPSRNWLVNTIGLKVPDNVKKDQKLIFQIFISIYHVCISLVYVFIGLFIIKLGIEIILENGFLGQNLIYIIFFK